MYALYINENSSQGKIRGGESFKMSDSDITGVGKSGSDNGNENENVS